MDVVTVDQFKELLPAGSRKAVTPDIIHQMNTMLNDPDMFETYRDNLLSYAKVMADGRFKLSSYVSAIKYVSHKLAGRLDKDAYAITFPNKMARFAQNKLSAKDISAYVSAYANSKLVTLIMEQAMIPLWLANQDNYQKAINVQVELMLFANSEKVRSDAANSVLTHLKRPESAKVELDINVKEDSAIAALRASTAELLAQQKAMIKSNAMTAQEVAHEGLVIDVEVPDDE